MRTIPHTPQHASQHASKAATAAATPPPITPLSVLKAPSSSSAFGMQPLLQRQARSAVLPAVAQSPSLAAIEHLNRSVASGLLSLPDLRQQTLDAFAAQGLTAAKLERLDLSNPATQANLAPTLARLKDSAMTQLDIFWGGFTDGRGFPRSEQFPAFLRDALREEVNLKIKDHDLHPDDAELLASALDTSIVPVPALHELTLNGNTLAGAFVIEDSGSGRHLLYVPGRGLEGFPSRQKLLDTLAEYMGIPSERTNLLAALPFSQQVASAESDNSVTSEQSWKLAPATQPVLKHAFEAQRRKQYADVDTAFALPEAGERETKANQWLERLQQAVNQPKQFGNEGMLDMRDRHLLKRAATRLLPDWYKSAGISALAQHSQMLGDWQASRLNLREQLGSAESPAAFIRRALQEKLGTELGITLDPDQLRISTRRPLPIGSGDYQQTQSLTELGLNGLANGDDQKGSDFLLNSTLAYQGNVINAAWVGLTPGYLAKLASGMPPPAQVRKALTEVFTANTLLAMNQVLDRRLVSLAYTSKLRGDLVSADWQAIKLLSDSSYSATPPGIEANLIVLNGNTVLKDVMVVRHGEGQQQRWLLYAPGAPRDRQWEYFPTQARVLQEVSSWSSNPDLSGWLLRQASPDKRPSLKNWLAKIAENPTQITHPAAMRKVASYNHAITAQVDANLVLLQTELKASLPDWYVGASPADRQQLNHLNEALHSWADHVESTTAPQQSFNNYLHDIADTKINTLLERAKGSVDPDKIIVTTPRETMTFTQLLRDGYDDSLGLLRPTADTMARFSGPPGVDLSRLTAETVAASVRGQWVGDRYITALQKSRLNPANPSYEPSRVNALDLARLQLQSATLASRIKHEITPRQEQWLLKSLANLNDLSTEARMRFPVMPLEIDFRVGVPTSQAAAAIHRETIDGVYVFTQPDAVGTPQRLIYTPNAPDGLLFRDYDTFNNSLHSPGIAGYYQKRASVAAQGKIAERLKVLQAGKGVLPAPELGAKNLLELFYNDPLNRQIENVQQTTLGKNEMISKLVLNSLELVATGMSAPFALPAIAMGAALSLKDLGLASLAVHSGNNDEALGHAYSSMFNIVGAALDVSGLLGLTKMTSVSTGGAKRLPGALDLDQAVPALAALPPAPPAGMLDLTLGGERFLVNQNPNVLGHFELYRQSSEGGITSTAQFAQKGVAGKWKRLGIKGGGKTGASTPDILRDVRISFDQDARASVTYSTDLGGYSTPIKFDINANAWRTRSGQAIRFDPASGRMKPVEIDKTVVISDATKNQAMSDLGLNITMPLTVAPLDRSGFKPIPPTISSIWIGKEMPLDHIKNLGANASAAAGNTPPLTMTLYVSIADETQLAATLKNIELYAPQLKTQNLTDTDFYSNFKTTKYNEQYVAESSGPAINYGAAVDTLRYPLIDHVGGIYLDVDDVIALPADSLNPLKRSSPFPKGSLEVGEGSLLLAEPVSHSLLKMNTQFNTSAFGSLPNNPTLKAMSEESYVRFQKNRDLFESRPYEGRNSQVEMGAYMERISEVTGPQLFNDVIRVKMPAFHKYSVLRRFGAGEFYLPVGEQNAAVRAQAAFADSFKPLPIDIGNAHTWLTTR